MKLSCILFVFLTNVTAFFAQESLEAIGWQARKSKSKTPILKAVGTIDSTFVYRLDTLQLPLFDDFSKSINRASKSAKRLSKLFCKFIKRKKPRLPRKKKKCIKKNIIKQSHFNVKKNNF